MPIRNFAHKIRIYPTKEQQDLLFNTFGCCRFLVNMALEQRSKFSGKDRFGKRIGFTSWSAELKLLKIEAPFLREVPHHCLQQALRDLDGAFTRFFMGTAGYPQPRRKFENESCRFPDPLQFKVGRNYLKLPKLGLIKAVIHRAVQGKLKSVTISHKAGHWFASIAVMMKVKQPAARLVLEGGFDLGVAQSVVESDGTIHQMPRTAEREALRHRRLHQNLSRTKKSSARRKKAIRALRSFEARRSNRRHHGAHQISSSLTTKYSHLAGEALKLKNMTASAAGTVEAPGRNVAQKRGLNRSILDIGLGDLNRCVAYKAGWRGTNFVQVNPRYTSQICSECEKHPQDAPERSHLKHGRISRDQFLCPLCGFAADADVNAARNILARGRLHWATVPSTTAGPAVSDRGALCGPKRLRVRPKHGVEAVIKILPQADLCLA